MVRGRGRGNSRRGGARGGARSTHRGRGRGVAVRGRGRGRGANRVARVARVVKSQNSQENNNTPVDTTLDINKDSATFFTTNATAEQHYEAQEVNRDKYIATIMTCDAYSIEITQNAKARSLAAAFARHDHKLIDFLLNHDKQYGFVDVLKAVTILDSAREARAKEKKIKRLELSGSKIKSHKLGQIKNDINNLTLLRPKFGTASGAVARHIRRWAKKFTKEELEFFALFMPVEQWKKLANIVHFNPTKDFQADWFLPFCFGAAPPKDSIVDKCRDMNASNVNDLIEQFDIPYSVLKKYVANFNDKSKLKIAKKQDKLDTIIWYYEDLSCPAIDDIIRSRLESGEKLGLGYGKLLERLLMFKDTAGGLEAQSKLPLFDLIIPIAENDLKKFIATVESPVAVIGDASGSMSVAIRTATIISSLLTAICSAKLSFFNHGNFYPKKNPLKVADVIDVAFETRADGSTAPAACLVPYYDNKEVIKTFVIVTDEEENADGTTADGARWRFYNLFMKYRETVYPAQLIFVSFLHHQHSAGQMYEEFVRNNVPNVSQFKFDRERPDLTKLDSILGKLCSNTSTTFLNDVEKLENLIKTQGVIEAFQSLNIKIQIN
jgi:hypothetical protein